MTRPHDQWTSAEIAEYTSAHRMDREQSSGSWAHPPRVRRSLFAGFNWPLFAGLVVIAMLATFLAAVLVSHIQHRTAVEAELAERLSKY